MPSTPEDTIRLDHVALASDHAWDQLTLYYHHLGGRWLGGPALDEESDFYFCQVEMAGGAKLELLEPIDGDGSDFLRRFLDRNGPGPHHLTFKVPDFEAALAAVADAGYGVIGVDRSDPDWQEAFLHPKTSHGIVIQLAHHGAEREGWETDAELPPSRRPTPPVLDMVEHLVADLDAATALFAGALGMSEKERGRDADGSHVLLTSGPWQLLLVEPSRPSWRNWLGARSGRLLRLAFTVDDPATVPAAVALGDGSYEISPERNLGTRLLLRAP